MAEPEAARLARDAAETIRRLDLTPAQISAAERIAEQAARAVDREWSGWRGDAKVQLATTLLLASKLAALSIPPPAPPPLATPTRGLDEGPAVIEYRGAVVKKDGAVPSRRHAVRGLLVLILALLFLASFWWALIGRRG